MEFLNIILDRVSNTVVFNIIQGRLPGSETHIHSVVDEDLIGEYLSEIERISSISHTITEGSGIISIDVAADLRKVGEAFYRQFFPEVIRDRLRKTDTGFLFFHVDSGLGSIPWELLHDGTGFFSDRFFIGRNVSGFWKEKSVTEKDRLRVLIIADPTEDLPWARAEGEGLFDTLNAEVSADRLDIQLLVGKRITKLNLLSALKDKHIVHYAGHVHHSANPGESGWLLYGNRILRAREIEKAGFAPDLVFSNSCFSSPVNTGEPISDSQSLNQEGVARSGDLALAFLKAGIYNFIGTNWEIQDSRRTFEFAIAFYRSIFEERSVGEALFDARHHSRTSFPSSDLTWANYVLHGNPRTRVYRAGGRRTFDASRNALMYKRITEEYPSPISAAYTAFTDCQNSGGADCLGLLCDTFAKTILVTGSVILGQAVSLHMQTGLPSPDSRISLEEWFNKTEEIFNFIKSMQIDTALPGIAEVIYQHRDSLRKMFLWRSDYLNRKIDADSLETYTVTYQYMLDNFLYDLGFFRKNLIFALKDSDENRGRPLHGNRNSDIRILPAEYYEEKISGYLKTNRSIIVYYNSSKKHLFSLEPFMKMNPNTGVTEFPCVTDSVI